jgi:lysozyme
MKTSDKGVELIKQFEGCRLTAYRCPAGVLTIGIGHTKNVKEGMTITAHEAVEYLKKDLETIEQQLNKLELDLTQNQFDALVSFCFNCGFGAFLKSTLLKRIKSGAPEPAVRRAFDMWVKAGRKTLPGLVRRRKAEADLYFS